MSEYSFTIFDTPIGACGLVWNARGIAAARLPEPDARTMRGRLLRRYPDAVETAPPPAIQNAIDDIVALLDGERRDFAGVVLDDADVPDFNKRVYEIARAIPPGETLTYGEVAERLGDKNLARAVGVALGQNPFPPIVPCHRVLAASGKTGGFSAPGGVATKLRMLTIEKAAPGGPSLFDALPLQARRP
jgi:methylated-DNA-[protein]-cysteine S-methyltransferase